MKLDMKRITLVLTLLVLSQTVLVAEPTSAKPVERLYLLPLIETSPSQDDMRMAEAQTDYKSGEAALRAKNFTVAEADFRASLALFPGEAYLGLAEALTAQGRITEAIQTYRLMFKPNPACGFGGSYITRTYLEYALLLDQTGQWAEAVAAYQQALPTLPGGELPKINARFDPSVPQPVALAAAVHVALGLDANFGCEEMDGDEQSQERAFQEYSKALQLAPGWDTANYYYGYGWQRLYPKSRARLGTIQQAKAALVQGGTLLLAPALARQRAALPQQKRATPPPKGVRVPAGANLPQGTLMMLTVPRSAAQKECQKEEYAVITRGDEALKAGDTDGAIAAFLEARGSGTESLLALIRLADAYTVAGRTSEAIAAYRQLLYPPLGQDWSHANQLSPTKQMNFALLLLQTGQKTEALAAYRRALTTLNYDGSGKPKLAVLLPDIAPGGLPYTPRLLRAMICLGLGIDTSGYDGDRLKEATTLAPDSAAANFYLGKYLYAGSEPGAKAALERAIELGDASTSQAAKVFLPFSR